MKKTTFIILCLVLIIIPFAQAKLIFFEMYDSAEVNHKTITLENVGSGGAIVVDVDGVLETILNSGTETVNGIIITNHETFYEDNKDQRSAYLDITFPEVNQLCSNGEQDSETEEEGVDCGGPYCSTKVCPTCDDKIKNQDETDIDCGGSCHDCKDGRLCRHDEDCRSEECSDEDICCTFISKVAFENSCKAKLISKGKGEDGCSLGWVCCGDNYCDTGFENYGNCPEDCAAPVPSSGSAGGGGAAVPVSTISLSEQGNDYSMTPGRLRFEFNEKWYAIQLRRVENESAGFIVMDLDENNLEDILAYEIIEDEFSLNLGEDKKTDLDRDNVEDVVIELNGIISNPNRTRSARFIIRKLSNTHTHTLEEDGGIEEIKNNNILNEEQPQEEILYQFNTSLDKQVKDKEEINNNEEAQTVIEVEIVRPEPEKPKEERTISITQMIWNFISGIFSKN